MRILKWSNSQLRARLKIAHAIIDEAVKTNDDLARKLKLCQNWTGIYENMFANIRQSNSCKLTLLSFTNITV